MSCKDLPAPSSLAEALQQRMDIYKSAAEGAKSKGDDRKARMHQRIVKVQTMHLKFSYRLKKKKKKGGNFSKGVRQYVIVRNS